MILDDIPQVVYTPVKVFKKIIENPKYLGAIIILLLFIGLQIGFEYVQFSRTYTENASLYTTPTSSSATHLLYTNATLWNGSQGVTISNNYNDFFNYSVYVVSLGYPPTSSLAYESLFGNSSLEINATNTNSISATLGSFTSVDCSASGFQNLSITIKTVTPQVALQSAALTLYSNNGTNDFYTYDLTSSLSNASAIGLWNNFTIPVGPSAQGWIVGGAPSWGNVTGLKLDFNYPFASNVTIRIGALFFRGQYETPIQFNATYLVLQFLETFSLQFIFSWFVSTGVIYLFFKGLKSNIVWKPLFVAIAFALFVLVIRALVNLIAAATLPTLYYPYDLSAGVNLNIYGALFYPSAAVGTLTTQSQAIFNSINSATTGFRDAVFAMFAISYVWLGALCTIIVGTLKPDFSRLKRIIISAVSVGATILLLLFLVGVV